MILFSHIFLLMDIQSGTFYLYDSERVLHSVFCYICIIIV